MKTAIGDHPIEQRYAKTMNALAHGVDEILNGEKRGDKRKNGFVLLVFPFEGHQGRCNYISNAQRDDVIVLLKEQLRRLRRFDGMPEATGHG